MQARPAPGELRNLLLPVASAQAPSARLLLGRWRDHVLVACAVLAWLAATAWMRPLMVPDEGRYVGVAWEMIRSGHWLTPTLDGLPFFHKPPLFYWITAAAMSVAGPHALAARTAPLLGAGLAAMSMYLFLRRWSGARAARLALAVLLAQPLFYVGAQFANLDMLVAGCIGATILLAADAVLRIEAGLRWRTALLGAWAMAAAGVLAKGLIGAVLPALVVLTWLALLRRWRSMRLLVWWPGMAAFLLIVAPWFVAMQSRYPGFLDYFFVVQHFQRFAVGGFNNVAPIWFYPVLLLLLFLPWLPWLARLARRVIAPSSPAQPVTVLMLVWTAVVVGFFSLPQSKLVGYILPAVPPLAALVVAGFLGEARTSAREQVWWRAAIAVAALAGIGTVVAVTVMPQAAGQRDLALDLREHRAAGEPVVMLGKLYYDVPVYARLADGVRVVDDWLAPDVAAQDNGRRELADAATFDRALAASVLLTPAALRVAICKSRTTWIIGPATAVSDYGFLSAAAVVHAGRDATLWSVDARLPAMRLALGCGVSSSVGPTVASARPHGPHNEGADQAP